MPFTYTWNAAFEAIPADAEDINLGASRIRQLKGAISERLEVDHSWAGDANDGLHLHSEYIPQGAVTPVNATDGVVYVAVVAGVAELFYKDTAGHTLQLTTNGTLRLGTVNGGADFVAPAAADLLVSMSVDSGKAEGVQFRTAGLARWLIQKDATAEGGANTGSDLEIVSANDAGVALGVPLKIYRLNGYITLAMLPTSMPVGVPGTLWNNAGVMNIST